MCVCATKKKPNICMHVQSKLKKQNPNIHMHWKTETKVCGLIMPK
jgi:hypothetical protein